ncbi:hypothetical protein GF323_01015 [Candidatus Woesearchaeota archaeon]|nr:hypothetical protein [Candidatus Woesearchaeota archaeon]
MDLTEKTQAEHDISDLLGNGRITSAVDNLSQYVNTNSKKNGSNLALDLYLVIHNQLPSKSLYDMLSALLPEEHYLFAEDIGYEDHQDNIHRIIRAIAFNRKKTDDNSPTYFGVFEQFTALNGAESNLYFILMETGRQIRQPNDSAFDVALIWQNGSTKIFSGSAYCDDRIKLYQLGGKLHNHLMQTEAGQYLREINSQQTPPFIRSHLSD